LPKKKFLLQKCATKRTALNSLSEVKMQNDL